MMASSGALVLACLLAVLPRSASLQVEQGLQTEQGLELEKARRRRQAALMWQFEYATRMADVGQLAGRPEFLDWQSEYEVFKNRSKSERFSFPPSDAEKEEQKLMGEAARALKQKSHPPHLVLIGDSLMRQQYFNLASWLIHGEARRSEPNHFIVADTYQKLWRAIFRHQNRELQGENVSEICHCGRDNRDANKHDFGDFVEDRFITLPGAGPSITYINWSGEHAFHGYFNPSDEHPTQASCKIGTCTSPFRWTIKQPEWQNAQGLVQFLSSVIMKLQPKPTHVMLNSGKWGHLTSRGLHNLFAAGAEIQKRNGTRFVWKTVTHSNSDKQHDSQAVVNAEKMLAMKYGWEVFDTYNMTSTYPGRAHNYRDDMHFEDRITTHFNRMYLESLLKTLQ